MYMCMSLQDLLVPKKAYDKSDKFRAYSISHKYMCTLNMCTDVPTHVPCTLVQS